LNESIQTQFRTIDGLSIRYAESDDRNDHALLLSPWPESLLAFEPTWARLAEHTHLVAIDLPGFGHSERRDALLSPRAMGEFIIRAADTFGLENPHPVGPDIGTGALLFAAASHPGRLRSVVVGSGGSAFPLQLGNLLKDWVEAPDFEEYRNADPRQIIAGGRDTAVPPVNGEFLHERLPKSMLDIIDAGHFTWEDGADEYAALVTSWWGGDYANVGSTATR
jgi:pimeloyl-ACP methyl ester carboxylesterase